MPALQEVYLVRRMLPYVLIQRKIAVRHPLCKLAIYVENRRLDSTHFLAVVLAAREAC